MKESIFGRLHLLLGNSSLQTRFLLRVLLPPFVILAVIGVAGFVVLSITVQNSATGELQRAAATTAAKLEREIALRKTVARSTGKQLFAIESDYQAKKQKLSSDYNACNKYVKTTNSYVTDVCKLFYAQFAVANGNLLQAVDEGLTVQQNELMDARERSMNQLLRSYVEFFPETSLMLVVSKDGKTTSQATNGGTILESYADSIRAIAKKAMTTTTEGIYIANGVTRQMVFAYPIDQGAVVASYDLDNAGFLYPSWKGAPIDSTRGYVVIADTKSNIGYPSIKDTNLYQPALKSSKTTLTSAGVDYLAVSEPVNGTTWRVVASSPKAMALETLANAQILAVAVGGLLLISFTWVGSRFVRRTVDSILGLVGGAVVFSSGQLTHRIDTARMSDKEFSQLAEIMNNMAVKIQAAEDAIVQKDKEFINVATHEIKAPITAIIGNLSMTLEDGMGQLDETARLLTGQAYSSTIRLRDLVNELLDIARLESGRASFNLESLDLTKEISDMITLQKTPAFEKKITVAYQPPAQPITVRADRTKLEIILTNFISNGIKYNRSPGELVVSQTLSATHVEIAIRDTGLGIPLEQQAHMFQKFFRVDAPDRAGIPGTGLGMYITKQFIEGMGGTLRFESEHGKGTTFFFTLPLATGNEKAPEQIIPVTRAL